jgi:hypothetical protein
VANIVNLLNRLRHIIKRVIFIHFSVKVLRQAPPDAAVKPVDYSGAVGPRFDLDGNIIPHSILGSVEEWKKRATERGDFQDVRLPEGYESQSKQPTLKYERKRKFPPSYMQGIQFDESNALKNWQAKMLERKRQQGYISSEEHVEICTN